MDSPDNIRILKGNLPSIPEIYRPGTRSLELFVVLIKFIEKELDLFLKYQGVAPLFEPAGLFRLL